MNFKLYAVCAASWAFCYFLGVYVIKISDIGTAIIYGALSILAIARCLR